MERLAGWLSNSVRTPLHRAIEAYRRMDLSQPPKPRATVRNVRRVRFLNAGELTRLVDRYEAGAKIQDLATEFGIDRRTVSHHLRKRGVSLRPYPPTSEQTDEMVRLYEADLSLADVGQRVGFSPFIVQRELQKRGIAIRPKTRRKK